MADGTVTRSITYARAYAWAVNGNNEDGSPKMEKVGNVEFYSTKPNKKQAVRALKSAGVNCSSQFVGFDILRTVVYAQDIDTFIHYGVEANRLPNGRITNDSETEDTE